AGEAVDLSADIDRSVRAVVIRRLMLRLPPAPGAAAWPMSGAGVRVTGALVVGGIDLEDGAGPGGEAMAPLILHHCDIPAPMRLSGARLARLSLRDSRLTELDAGGLRVEGGIDLAGVKPAEAHLHVFLNGARIAGDVRLEGARLNAPKRTGGEVAALDLHGARVEGRVLARRDFQADGKVWLNGATIDGNVDFTRALLVHPHAGVEADVEAINLAQARINGSVLFFASTVSGVANLRHARISEDLRVVESTLSNPARERTRRALALQASGLETKGSVILREADLEGAVRLASARVGERVELRRCRADGDVNCSDIHVAGDFEWRGLSLSRPLDAPAPRLSLAGARVDRLIYATRFNAPNGGVIDLTGARAGALRDRVDQAWGEDGDRVVLELDGFEYGRLESPDGEAYGRDLVAARRAWLKRQPPKSRHGSPQPYAQLARALRA
ncbi:MAG: hypothetical protein MI723_16445, partial [Caulobacterales bacterium]|nr:hypothetical protein [Caulobacterales bacterium]